MVAIPAPFTTTRELPPYTGVLAVDALGFTTEPGSTHQHISHLIPQLVRQAFDESGVGEAWQSPPFFANTGDGLAIGVPTRLLPALVHPFLAVLQQVLTNHNATILRGQPVIRLRVSLHVGPLPVDPDRPEYSGNGTARNDTHRLLDSDAVRIMLAAAEPSVTHVAAILSDRVFCDVVRDGYTSRHPDHFIEVAASVPGKGFSQRAWLYVPEPSGSLLAAPRFAVQPTGQPAGPEQDQAGSAQQPTGSADAGREPGADPRRAPDQRGELRIRRNSGQAANQVNGGMWQSRGGRTGWH
ncbi:hypothetical protein O7623_15170 [Solwaraspora sp. WMMD791]|uniref:hypothetical protein n=1 Tax=Solwaraspora sp. WMMD791 TaxID=3016086 RepID=UPI00249CCF84|nr:hypothetical protein [Solwaraspora sp. WMMD791]WFE30440.1 hypothetical protein O7623_15170 [Solwaraspora sp. WMMD791]